QGPGCVGADGEGAGAHARGVGPAVRAAQEGARRVRGRRPAADAGRLHLRALEARMRIALLDPPSFTAPYDHALAAALARRGHDVTLLTSPFTHGEAPSPDGYAREEIFLPVSSRLVRRSPRSRLRLPLKGAEYAPSAARLLRRAGQLDSDAGHSPWPARPPPRHRH